MTTIYLIRHSIKEKNFGEFDSSDSFQIRNEKLILSSEGEEKAIQLSKHIELENINELWTSNYVRAISTAKYIAQKNNIKLNISSAFDERHYGDWNDYEDKEKFWINQFLDANLKNINGESQKDVQNRMHTKIKEIFVKNDNKKVAIVCHNACILFYLLKFCKLEKAELNKRLTIKFKDKILIEDSIMKSPSIMKLEFENNKLLDISYIEID